LIDLYFPLDYSKEKLWVISTVSISNNNLIQQKAVYEVHLPSILELSSTEKRMHNSE